MADDIKALEHESWLAVTARRHGWLVAKSTASHNSAAPKLFFVRGHEHAEAAWAAYDVAVERLEADRG